MKHVIAARAVACNESRCRYPVVYLLHGYGGSDLSYFGPERVQAHLIADRVFDSGAAQEMILVMPNCMNVFGGCVYSSSVTTGDWESYIAEDLVAYMDEHYRTLARRESRGLAGHSMGGYGTLRIGMKRPDVFSALYALSSFGLNEGTVRARGDGPSPAEAISSLEDARGNPAAQGTLARAAAWSPNPENPPLFLDLPTKNGEVVPEVAVKYVLVEHGDRRVGHRSRHRPCGQLDHEQRSARRVSAAFPHSS